MADSLPRSYADRRRYRTYACPVRKCEKRGEAMIAPKCPDHKVSMRETTS